MRVFWLTFFTALLLVVAVNVSVDPSQRWHTDSVYRIDHKWAQDECHLAAPDIDLVPFRLHQVTLITQPEVLVLGSSRAMQIASSMFSKTIYNGSAQGAELKTYATIWRMFSGVQKAPDVTILMLDPSQFRSATIIAPGAPSRFEKIHLLLDELKETVSWQILKESIHKLPEFMKKDSAPLIGNINSLPSGNACIRSDGSLIYADHGGEKRDWLKVKKSVAEYLSADPWSARHLLQRDHTSVAVFERFIEELQRSGSSVRLVISPLQTEVLGEFKARPEMRQALTDIQSYAEEISKTTGATLCNRLNPADIPCEHDEFMDNSHMLTSCAAKLIRSCFPDLAGG